MRKRTLLLLCYVLMAVRCSHGQNDLGISYHVDSDEDMTYFGLRPPGSKPEVFAPHIVSKPDRHEFGAVFSEDGKEFFFGVDNDGRAGIFFSKLENGVWPAPQSLLVHKVYSFNDPMLSPDGNRLYFISDMPMEGKGDKKDYDIWYIERSGSHWSDPVNIGEPINTAGNEYYISFTENGTLYFSSNKHDERNYDIFYSEHVDGVFKNPIRLDDNINSERYEADAFIAPDRSYIIFSAIRKEGFGQGDLYISFRDDEGNWSKARNMGDDINDEHHQLCPFVSKDGKYLFFTSNQDIYWVDAAILDN